jgi:hypothetical protein
VAFAIYGVTTATVADAAPEAPPAGDTTGVQAARLAKITMANNIRTIDRFIQVTPWVVHKTKNLLPAVPPGKLYSPRRASPDSSTANKMISPVNTNCK